MMGIKRAFGLGLLATTLLAGSASAVQFGSDDYDLYSGNLNGDGCEDIYLKAKKRIILIAGDIITPILTPPPANSSYKILSSLVNGQCTYPNANIVADNHTVDITTLATGRYQYVSGDFNGDGFQDVRLIPAASNLTALALAGGSTPSFFDEFVAVAPNISTPPQTNLVEVLETDRVGTMAGSFRVDESGSATYSIPVATAAGTAGVAPQLSLNYTSQGGNGLAGLGWNIGGLSGISRSRQTLQQDGMAKPLTWGAEDRFALDGQRLILVAGTYGARDSEYRTEIDSFAKIYARGGSTGHPDYWEVKRKDGSTSYYGKAPGNSATDGKQNNSAGQTLTWALKKFQDSVGNPIWFEYYNDANGHRIKEVKYAYGSATGPSGHNARVVFNYDPQPRPDPTSGYVTGHLFTTTKRLLSVVSYNGSTELRSYHLKYLDQSNHGTSQTQPSTDKLSRVASIQECVLNSCLPASTFDWTLPSLGVNTLADSQFNFDLQHDDGVVDYRPTDINGDGRLDLVWLRASTNTSGQFDLHKLRYALAKPDGSGFGALLTVADLTGTFSTAMKIEVLDYNADGRMDVLLWDHTSWKVHLSTPQGNGTWLLSYTGLPVNLPASEHIHFADVNSDGLVDAVEVKNGTTVNVHYLKKDSSQTIQSNRYYHFGTAEPLVAGAAWNYGKATSGHRTSYSDWQPISLAGSGDLDGDGRSDSLARYQRIRTSHAYEGRRTRYTTHTRYFALLAKHSQAELVDLPRNWLSAKDDHEKLVDLNGDGLTDRVFYDRDDDGVNHGWYYQLGLGRGDVSTAANDNTSVTLRSNWWSARQPLLPMGAHNNKVDPELSEELGKQQVQLVDYNRDGFPDLTWLDVSSRQLKVRHWNGNGFDAAVDVKYTTASLDNLRFQWMDVNADGITDLVQFNLKFASNSTVKTYLSSQQNKPTNRITQVTNGLGAETEISYGTLAASGHYNRIEVGTTTASYSGPCFLHNPHDPRLPSSWEKCDYTYNTANSDDFYAALNRNWVVNPGAHILSGSDSERDPVLELNGPMYVVTKVNSSAPAAGATAGTVNNNATSSISYYYGEAKIQAMGRGFLGFQRLSTVDDQTGVITTTTYRQDFPFIGSPLKTEVRGPAVNGVPGPLLSESENTWKLKRWNNGGSSGSHTNWTSGIPSTKLYAPYLAKSVEKTYDLNNNGVAQGTHLQTVTTDNVYDGYGNPEIITVTTKDETSSDRFVKTTTNTYGSSPWDRQMGRLSRTQVVSTRSGSVSDTKTRTSAFTYITSGTIGSSTRGLLATEVIEPDNNAYKLTTTYLYDAFGNKRQATTSGAGVAPRYSRSEYDSLGRYVERSFNSLEQKTSEVMSRNTYGQVTRARDLNGLNVYSNYSPLGRKYFERSDTGGYSKTLLTGASTQYCPSGTVYKATSDSAGGGQSQQCFDKLGRAVRSLTRGFNGSWIASDVEFDNLGRTKRQSEPYFLTNNAGSITGAPAHWTTINYDILGRPTLTTLPDSSTGTVQYNGYTTVTINDKGRRKVETKNALGEMVSVTDNQGGVANETSTVTYAYDAQGNMTTMTDSASNVSTISYDLLGRKIGMNDPDKGSWSYVYNVYGELTSQTDANGQISTLNYDVLGRLISREDKRQNGTVESDTAWAYNNGAYGTGLGLGLLNNVQQDNGNDSTNDYVKAVTYDSRGRVTHTTTTLGAAGADGIYIEQVTYDQYGRSFQTFDAATNPTGANGYQGTQNHYNQYGYLDYVGDVVNGTNGQPRTIYRRITGMDARGNVTHETRGDGVNITRVYDPKTGRIKTIDAKHSVTDAEVQDLEYDWDTIGNLNWRDEQSGTKNLRETFGYDGLNRLTSYQVAGQTAKTVRYDALGNIEYKSDVGTYAYGSGNTANAGDAGPHAVTQITGAEAATYTYDNNGNNLTGDGRTIVYSTFDKPLSITKGGHTTAFQYGPDRARYKRTDTNSSGTKTTLYVGNTEWITKTNGDKEIKRHLGGALITLKLSSTNQLQSTDTHYQYHDHLGSLDVITNHLGAIVQELSFDAWGERRDATDWTALANSGLTGFDHSITTRGFTGHEMLDEVGVIHMNGRIYDAKIARFLQADPHIQAPLMSQSLNRYSYVINNPLNATDPSGFFFKKYIGAIVATVLTVFFPPAGIWGAALIGGVSGGVQAAVNGGNILKGVFQGAVTAAAFYAVGQAFNAAGSDNLLAAKHGVIDGASLYNFGGNALTVGQIVQQIALHAVVGGIVSDLQGGKFGHGFLTAGLTKGVTGSYGKGGFKSRLVVSSVLGGTISKLTGGKFSNGARTATFQFLFNEFLSSNPFGPSPPAEEDRVSVFDYEKHNNPEFYADFEHNNPVEYAAWKKHASKIFLDVNGLELTTDNAERFVYNMGRLRHAYGSFGEFAKRFALKANARILQNMHRDVTAGAVSGASQDIGAKLLKNMPGVGHVLELNNFAGDIATVSSYAVQLTEINILFKEGPQVIKP